MTKKYQSIINKIAPLISLAVLMGLWLFVTEKDVIADYMLPSPSEVTAAFISEFPLLIDHAAVTLQEAFYGLLLGVAFAFIIALVMDRVAFIRKAVYPLLVISQTIPTIAIAPLLVLWLGFDMAPKITLVVLTTFFPIAVALLDGFQSADKDEINLLRSIGASKLQIFLHIKLPGATEQFFSGLKVSASYAIVGAVISEWVGGFEGLGVYMIRVKQAYAFDKMFAVIILISALSLVLMAAVTGLKKLAMPYLKK